LTVLANNINEVNILCAVMLFDIQCWSGKEYLTHKATLTALLLKLTCLVAFHPINKVKVTLCQVQLVLELVTACGQVNHLGTKPAS